jgi:hypothetical protein
MVLVLGSFVLLGYKYKPKNMRISSVYTGYQLVYTGSGLLWGVIISKDGSSPITTFDIYDNTTATGTKMIPTMYFPTSGTDRASSIGFGLAIPFSTGLYVDLTCAGTVSYVVYYYAF